MKSLDGKELATTADRGPRSSTPFDEYGTATANAAGDTLVAVMMKMQADKARARTEQAAAEAKARAETGAAEANAGGDQIVLPSGGHFVLVCGAATEAQNTMGAAMSGEGEESKLVTLML